MYSRFHRDCPLSLHALYRQSYSYFLGGSSYKVISAHIFLSTIFVYSSNVSSIQIDENVALLM